MTLPGMVHIAVLRSPMAHAKIVSVDTTEAKSRPGVIAVYTGQDFAETQGNLPCAWPVTPDMVNPGAPSVAVDQVNHVGEIVAVVVGRDKASAQDALEGIDVEYDQLAPVLDMEAALVEGSTKCPPDHTDGNKSYTWAFESGAAGTGAPIEEALSGAEVTVKRRFIQQRLIPAFMEPRATVVQPVGDGVTVWSSTQIPHILRTMLALTLGIEEQNVRVIAPDVGGGFGGKIPVTPEEVITVLVARKLGKPAKYNESRSESLMSAHHGRDQIQDITITAKRDGTITGLDVHLFADMGAYLRLVGPGVPVLGAFMFPAIYKIPAYRFVCDGVFTTKTPTDAYRGAGRPEATYAIERIMDELAVELGMDPMELRQQELDHARGVPVHHRRGADLRQRQLRGRDRQGPRDDGLGRAQGRARPAPRERRPGAARPRHLHVHRDVRPGAVAGARLARLRRRRLGDGLDPDAGDRQGRGRHRRLGPRPGPRDGVQPDRRRQARRRVRGRRGHPRRHRVLAQGPGHLRLALAGRRRPRHLDGRRQGHREGQAGRRAPHGGQRGRPGVRERAFSVKGSPGASTSIQEIAFATFMAHNLPDGMEPTLDSSATYDPENFSFPHGTHLAAIEVDTETGFAKIRKYVWVDDIGIVINPLIGDGPDARRARAGHRAGDVRGGGVRRRRQPHDRHVRRLPAAVGGGPAALRPRPHRHPGDQQPARRQGCRRGRLHRLDPGDHQRGRRRHAALRRQRHPDAGDAGAGVAGDPPGQGEVRPLGRRQQRLRRRQHVHQRRFVRRRLEGDQL